ncbi:unnamed protein product [Blepharisma stoltei]|uniref:Uncharacterized protein n=1 Tax=Blepharisma stoltei TaxID=1481888 RepID=A0AAU9JE39_9CILI|nr:unnamed protein product [Blepharisma stoltei]
MQRMLFVFLGLACLSAAVHSEPTPADALNFVKGLLSGLQANPEIEGTCQTQLNSESALVQEIVSNFQSILHFNFEDTQTLITNLKAFASSLHQIAPACNLEALEKQLIQILNPSTGLSILMTNYFKHSSEIHADMKVLTACSADYAVCGQSLGNAIQLLVGWTLTAGANPTPNYDFFNGLLAGLAKNGVSKCVADFTGLEPQFTQISNYIKKLEGGDIFVLHTMLNLVVKIEDEIFSWNADCNYTALIAILKGLGTQSGTNQVVTNYLQSFSTINNDFLSLGNGKCESPYECGHNLGEGIRLLLGWGI